jgi:Tfp pilus assembly protein PilF
LRFFLYQQGISAEDHLSARIALERAVELQPRYADAWAALALVCIDEDRHAFNPQPNSLDRALHAAARAAGLDPANRRVSVDVTGTVNQCSLW